jgi:hypothetical protein
MNGGAGGDQRQQGVKKAGHGGIALSPYAGTSYTFVVPRLDPVFPHRNDRNPTGREATSSAPEQPAAATLKSHWEQSEAWLASMYHDQILSIHDDSLCRSDITDKSPAIRTYFGMIREKCNGFQRRPLAAKVYNTGDFYR